MFKITPSIFGAAILAVPLNIFQTGEAASQELDRFGVIAGQSLTNTGTTLIDGNIAVWPGTSFTGSGSVVQSNGVIFLGDAVAQRVQDDLTTLYLVLEGRPPTSDLTGQDLDTMVLTSGVYNFDTSANLANNGTLRLDAEGNTDAVFIFNIGSTLTVGSNATVLLENGAQGGNVFYRIGSSATLDTSSDLKGQLVALTSITMNTSATLACGAAYARNGSVTLDTNIINICTLGENGGNGGNGGGVVISGYDHVVLSSGTSEQEKSVARALSEYLSAGNALPLGFAILAVSMGTEELAASLAQMSGEVSTGVAPMGMQSMDAFLDTVLRSGRSPRAQVFGPAVQDVPIGMVQKDAFYTGKHGSKHPTPMAETLATASSAAPQTRNWGMWASAYGSRSVTGGNMLLGAHERTSENRGLAAGLNFASSNSTDFGIALSRNTADFALTNGFGSGASDSVLVALRGRTSSDRGYLEGALAYGRSDITTDRTVTIAGIDRFIAKATAETLAAHVEAGYHMGILTPFAGLRALSLKTPAYSETTASGSSSYALRYDARSMRSVRSELGVEMQWAADTSGPGTTAVGLRAAWVHEFASNDPGTSSFVNIPNVSFPVSGASRGRDSLALAASARMMNRNGIFVDASITTEYSKNSHDFGGSVSMGYRW